VTFGSAFDSARALASERYRLRFGAGQDSSDFFGDENMNKGTALVGFLLSFLAGAGLVWGVAKSSTRDVAAEPAVAALGASPIPIAIDDPSWGNPDAPVTIVEISDFECPFCSRATPTLERIQKEYGASRVRILWKNNPLPMHANARPAAEAGATVQALGGDFWKFNRLAFAHQKELTRDNFQSWAVASGVDAQKFALSYDSRRSAAKIDKDIALARQLGANSTPHFFVNGKSLVGAQPYEQFKRLIDEQLGSAAALLESGVAANRVSLELTRKNWKSGEANDQRREPSAPPRVDTTLWKVSVEQDDPVRGAPDALVTLVEFSDFQCPYCSRVEPTLQKLLDEYKQDLRIVWKDNPIPSHPRARPAAYLGRLAYAKGGNSGFWAAHDALFASQGNLEEEGLRAVAQKLNLSWEQVVSALAGGAYRSKIAESWTLAQDFAVQGTPHFFINGRRLVGAQPYEKFKELVEVGLTGARSLLQQGVSRDKVFRELMKSAREAPEPEKKQVPVPGADSPFKGARDAKVVIQEFSDFECPYCSRVNPTIERILKEYPRDVKLVWRHMPMPFHAQAALAAEAAAEAFEQQGNVGFWKYHDKLFSNQKALGRSELEKYASELGLDPGRFAAALDARKHKARVERDLAVGNQAAIGGTPGFVVNGYFVSGAQPFEAFDKLIKLAIKGG